MTGGGATGAVGSRGDGRRGYRGRRGGGGRMTGGGTHIKTPFLTTVKSTILHLLKKVKAIR